MKIFLLSFSLFLIGCGKGARESKPLSQSEQNRIISEFLTQRKSSCDTFKKDIPKDWLQGTIEVPENPNDKDGKKINIFYYGKLLYGMTPAIFFNGGPSGSSFGSFYILKDKNASLIFIDQRGTGCSDFYPIGGDNETLQRLRHYGSSGIVADAEAVRKKINKGKPWIAFGQSYGGFIAHRYLINSPKGISAAISHGNAINDDGFTRIKNRVGSHLRVIKKYLKKYPDDAKRIETLSRNLNFNECYKEYATDRRVCGYALLREIPSMLAFTDVWPTLHSWLEVIVPNDEIDWDAMTKWVNQFVFNDSSPYLAQDWSMDVINFVDRNVAPFNKNNCERIRDELIVSGLDISHDPLNECAPYLQNPEKGNLLEGPVKILKQDLMTNLKFAKALAANPHIHFYLYSGENDQTVPKENFEDEIRELAGLKNFKYQNFSESGHDGFYSEPLVWKNLKTEAQTSF